MKKIAALLFAILIMTLACLTVSAATPTAINSATDLMQMTETGNYYLAKDIVLNGNFTPLKTFSGTLDGRGKKIVGLKMSVTAGNTATVYRGLFEKINGGTVKNITLQNVDISVNGGGTVYVGAVAGKIDSGSVFNCRVGGKITLSGDDAKAYVGGIAGVNSAEIYLCENYTEITAKSLRVIAGGIAGEHGRPDYVLNQCSNSGKISAFSTADTNYVGGIVGRTENSVSNCVNYGSVYLSADGSGSVGGIAGILTNGDIKTCYSGGTLEYDGKSDGAIDPIVAEHKDKFSNNYYLDTVIKDLNTSEVKTASALDSRSSGNAAVFSGFDFENCWQMVNSSLSLRGVTCALPLLDNQQSDSVSNSVSSSQGDTTSAEQSSSAVDGIGSEPSESGQATSSAYTPSTDDDSLLNADTDPSDNTPPIWIFIVIAVCLLLGVGVFLYFYEKKKNKIK